VSGWPFKWSQDEPKEPGLYLICWYIPVPEVNPRYELYQWDGKEQFGISYTFDPTHWQRVTSPAEDIDLMKEYENATT
jgi:hypothetical protein